MRDSTQLVKISSNPVDAKVYFNGTLLGVGEGTFVGKTPGFMKIKRKFFSRALFSKEGYDTKKIWLDKKYRWQSSFFANMVFLFAAPVGWIVDLVTGAAWEYDSIHQTSLFSNKVMEELPPPPKVIAISPPQHKHELVSDKIGIKLKSLLKKRYPQAVILPYQKTSKIFISYSFTHNNKPLAIYLPHLENDLKATHIANSHIMSREHEHEHEYEIETDLYSIFTEATIDSFSNKYSQKKIYKFQFQQSTLWGQISPYISFFPNALSTEVIASPLSVTLAGGSNAKYKSDTNPTNYLNGISVSNIKSPKLTEHYRFIARTFPELTFAFRQIQFNRTKGSLSSVSKISFNWYGLAMGYGAEIGLESPFGYPSLRFIGALAYDHISWDADSAIAFSFRPSFEIGYAFYTQDKINIKIFYRGAYFSDDIWSDAMTEYANTAIKADLEDASTFGVRVSYYFPEAKIKFKELLY